MERGDTRDKVKNEEQWRIPKFVFFLIFWSKMGRAWEGASSLSEKMFFFSTVKTNFIKYEQKVGVIGGVFGSANKNNRFLSRPRVYKIFTKICTTLTKWKEAETK